MKQLKEQLGARAEAAMMEAARRGEGAAGWMRVVFALVSAAMAAWMWQHFTPVRLIYLMLAVLWALQAVLARLMARAASVTSLSATTLLDVTIINIGLLVFVQWGLFPKYGAGVFLFYFPVLALAAARFRPGLVSQAALYAGIFYGVLSLYGGSPPWFRLLVLALSSALLALVAARTKALIVDVAGQVVEEAYQQGARLTARDLTAETHALLLPPPLLRVPGLWAASKHGAGTVTGGDFFQLFETPRGPLLVAGDFGGTGFDALRDIVQLREQFAQTAQSEPNLPEILARVNRYVYEKYNGARPLTCVLARWEGDQMSYINAGHLPALHVGKQTRTQLPATAPVVGLDVATEFREQTISFPPRDLLLVYTDGLFAKLTADRAEGVARIEAFAEQFAGAEVTTLCHRIFDCAQPGYEPNPDDSTMIVIRRQQPEVRS